MALQKATKTIPIVFVGVRDLVVVGLVASMGRPSGNITGVTLTPNAELVQKHLELLAEIVPKATRLAVFWNPDVPVQALVVKTITDTAQKRGIAVRAFEVHRQRNLERSFEAIALERFDGLLTLVEWFTFGQRPLIARLAIENSIPTFFEVKDYVKAGGLLSYGVVYQEHFASPPLMYVDGIFKGARPSDLPSARAGKIGNGDQSQDRRRVGNQDPVIGTAAKRRDHRIAGAYTADSMRSTRGRGSGVAPFPADPVSLL